MYMQYPPSGVYENLILARNLALHGEYKLENDKNIILASSRVKEGGVQSSLGNKLTPILYSWIFKNFNWAGTNAPIYISIFLYALSTIFLFFIVLKLFSVQGAAPDIALRSQGGRGSVSGGNYKLAVIFSIFYIFSPVIWLGSLFIGSYEFAFFFFSLGLLIYFYSKREYEYVISARFAIASRLVSDESERVARRAKAGIQNVDYCVNPACSAGRPDNDKKYYYLFLIISGIFLSLAALSRNAYLISILPILIYDFFKTKSLKRLLWLVFPVLLIVGGFNYFDAIKGNVNYYLSSQIGSFTTYGHLFRDPYTYQFEKDQYLEFVRNIHDPDISEFLLKYGHEITPKERLLMYFNSAAFYPKKILLAAYFGGPLLILLIIFGAIYLYRNKRGVFNYFCLFWLVFWYLALVILKTNNWDHFLEISFPMVLMMSLGFCWLTDKSGWSMRNKKFCYIGLFLFIFLQLVFANVWLLREAYNSSSLVKYPTMIEGARQAGLTENDIVAVGFHQAVPEILNYYTDKSYIYFAPETVEKLLKENKLKKAFEYFGVTRFIGYDDKMSDKIFEQIGIEVIKI